jgi:phosphosulfolactate synthase
MNFELTQLPERTTKPRKSGLTMAMDKGLSLREVEDFISVSGNYVDYVKLGWATSFVTPMLEEKLQLYKKAGIPTYFGGTLFEAFVIRGQYEEYKNILRKYHMSHVEVSDGSIDMETSAKLHYISDLAKEFTVHSEVGSKDANKVLPPYIWVQKIKEELEAGSDLVTTEAREGGNVGVFQSSGEVRSGLIMEILHEIDKNRILWEAPKKEQQIWFIKEMGNEVNLGNIAPEEVIPLETLRLGLRGDTFHLFLGK